MSTRRRRPGDASAALIFALVAVGCATMWAVWAGVLMLLVPSGPRAAGWTWTLAGSVVLVVVALLVASLLRGPARIRPHDPSGIRWSLRAAPVPLRLATSAPLAHGSRGEALAAQVVRAATGVHTARRVDQRRAVLVLQQILALAERPPGGPGSSDGDAEWSQVRAAVVDLTLRASDHPPHPVTLLPWEQHLAAPR
ncbi:hypothetical protein M1843_16840 [Isoptericola sp. 4D.3]|jgi:hypothetical protein|uniref:Uncharacterized protein n=1 Tax=Isoptericola peretonis TaxID=2918523 RepID=A0ABT0J7E2_9MICO|nr:hypothetical protein [Isoptericola sp. 4D.3]